MSDLQFDDTKNEFGAPPTQNVGSDLTGKIVKWGLAKDRKQAEYVEIVIVIAVIILAVILYKILSGGNSAPPMLPQ